MSNRLFVLLAAPFAMDVACGGVVEVARTEDGGNGGSGGSQSAATGQGGAPLRRPPGSGYCGDRIKNGDEACDLYDFAGETCRTATMGGAVGGTLGCTSRCTLDLSGCTFKSASSGFGTAGMMGIGGMTGAGGAGGFPSNTGGTSASSGGSDAGSIGDPHVMTLDGLKYDFQAVGEFVLVEDEDDPSFRIQVRQAPFLGLSTMSVNTAVAASVVGDRVAFYAGADPAVRIDGVARRLMGRTTLPRGGTLTNDDGTYTVTWPTGEELVVATVWKSLVNVNYRPSAAGTRRSVRGLLGTHDGLVANDLTTRSGKTLHLPARPEDLYRVFGRSYRIRDSESLFDYSPGESTATYTDRSFPLLHGTPAHPPNAEIARAQAICSASGVVGSYELEACAVDVALTGDAGFAKAAASRKPAGPRGLHEPQPVLVTF